MDLLILKALVLGLIEGLTEFLPVSSTGHLIIAGDLLDFNDEKGKVFEIAIQLGAILAVCWEYRGKIGHIARGLGSDRAARGFAANLLIAFLPAAILGLIFHKAIKHYLFHPFTVAIALILGGLIIFWVEKRSRQPRIQSVDEICWKDALKIGVAQSVALFPGISRSGATIMGGLVFGLSRQAATEFSFFLAIPTMFAATIYDVSSNWQLLHANDIGMFATGFIAAFISALLAVRALLHYVAHHSFAAFAWYRIALGTIVLAYFW